MSRRLAYHPPASSAAAEMRKCGRNRSGTQKYQCRKCGRSTAPNPKSIAHSPQTRQRALRLVAEGLSQRQAGRILWAIDWGLAEEVCRRLASAAAQTCYVRGDRTGRVIRLCTNKRYLITALSWSLVAECTTEAIQALVDQAPNTFQFCSDGHAGYRQVNYRRSRRLVGRGKSQTYSVHAELLAVGASDAGGCQE